MDEYNDWFGDTFSEIVVKYQIRRGFEHPDLVAKFVKEDTDCPEENCVLDLNEVKRMIVDLAKKVEDEKKLLWYLQSYLRYHPKEEVDIYDYESGRYITIDRLTIEKESESIERALDLGDMKK